MSILNFMIWPEAWREYSPHKNLQQIANNQVVILGFFREFRNTS